MDNQINRNYSPAPFYQQKIDPNFKYRKVSYNHPPESSYKVNRPVSFSNISDQKYQYNNPPRTHFETVTSTLPKASRIVNTRSSNAEPKNFYQEQSIPIFQSSLTNMNESPRKSNNKQNKLTQENGNESKDPNTISIKNNNGPETFTITHKT
jgi:hypothetical protein